MRKWTTAEERAAKVHKTSIHHFGFIEKVYRPLQRAYIVTMMIRTCEGHRTERFVASVKDGIVHFIHSHNQHTHKQNV